MDINLKVLLVDDVATVRGFLHQTLMHLGVTHIDEAANARLCLDACKNEHYDIVFLDIELPDGDGKNLIAEIVKHSPNTNVVMVSAHSDLQEVQRSLEQGSKGFVVKPFSPQKIASTITHLYPEFDLT